LGNSFIQGRAARPHTIVTTSPHKWMGLLLSDSTMVMWT